MALSSRGAGIREEESNQSITEVLSGPTIGRRWDEFLLDFQGVEYVSSDVLVSLVRLRRSLEAAGERLILCNLSPPVAEVFVVTGLGRFFDIRTDQPEANRDAVLRVGFQ
jgi:anti-anti-sigma factor